MESLESSIICLSLTANNVGSHKSQDNHDQDAVCERAVKYIFILQQRKHC